MPGDRRADAAEHASTFNEAAGCWKPGPGRRGGPRCWPGGWAARSARRAATSARPPRRRVPVPERPRCSRSGFRAAWPPRSGNTPGVRRTVSAVAAQALEEFLGRTNGDRPGRWRELAVETSSSSPPCRRGNVNGHYAILVPPARARTGPAGGGRKETMTAAAIYARSPAPGRPKDDTISAPQLAASATDAGERPA